MAEFTTVGRADEVAEGQVKAFEVAGQLVAVTRIGGSLYAFGDTGSADDQRSACRRSGGLLCFQASNIVVVLDDESSGLEAQRLAVAMKRLATQ